MNSTEVYQNDDRKWDSLFESRTWMIVRELFPEKPTEQNDFDVLYRLLTDERFRETCERFVRAENEHNVVVRELAEARETIAQKDAELLKAKEMIEKLKKEAKGANS